MTIRSHRRALLLSAMVVAVLAGHACVGRQWALTVDEWRSGPPAAVPVEVTVAGDLRPQKPARKARPAAPPPPAPALAVDAAAEASTGSVIAPSSSAVGETPPAAAVADAASAVPAASSALVAEAAASAPVAESTAKAVDPWPPSTRIRYNLRGNFRGEFSGSAQVLWLRDGGRYRVEMEIAIGPRSTPLMSRRVSSEGALGPAGLVPKRYEEETKALFTRTRRVGMQFEPPADGQPGTAVLQDGTRRPAPPGTQDSASQFVQLAWLFGTHAGPVRPGDRVSFPLALSRRSDVWTYLVGEPVTVQTPAGPVETIHARPQREVDPLRRDLVAEVWFAPALQYLPVRLRVMVDEDTFAVMEMEGLPELVQVPLPTSSGDRLPTAPG